MLAPTILHDEKSQFLSRSGAMNSQEAVSTLCFDFPVCMDQCLTIRNARMITSLIDLGSTAIKWYASHERTCMDCLTFWQCRVCWGFLNLSLALSQCNSFKNALSTERTGALLELAQYSCGFRPSRDCQPHVSTQADQSRSFFRRKARSRSMPRPSQKFGHSRLLLHGNLCILLSGLTTLFAQGERVLMTTVLDSP